MTRLRSLLAVALTLALAPAAALAQGTIRGRVTEQGSGQALQGVQIAVVGGGQTVVTNQQGAYVLNNVPAGQRTVRATRIGYSAQTRTVTVGAAPAEANFTLGADVLGLDEVVVIGYGQVERRTATGSIASIRPDEVTQSAPTATIENVLQGRVAGVQVSQNSGVPGSAISVRVRGSSSITAGNEPLYVIDGVPLIQGDLSQISIGQTQGIDALSDLNPNEIESIEVLKDASAAAIYGSRASNGVVLVTTKRGRAGDRPDIRFQTYYGVQEAWRQPDYLNAADYIEVYNEGYTADGEADVPLGGGETLHVNLFGYQGDAIPSCDDWGAPSDPLFCDAIEVSPDVDTDWIDEILESAPMSNLFGSIAGGTERARYYVSGTRFLQDGIVSGYGFERMNGRVNLDYTASDRLTLGTSVALTRSNIERARGDNTIYGPFANAVASAPVDAVYNEDGTYNLNTLAYSNPVALNIENRAEERSFHVLGNLFADYRLLEGVTARANFGLDQYSLRGYLYDSPIVGAATGSNGFGEVGNSYATKVLTEGTVSWNRDLNESNLFSGVAGASYEANDTEFNSVFGTQFPTSSFKQLQSASTITGGSSSITEYNLMSFFGRLQHTWRERFTTTFNVRADGSSRFGENNRWGVFPSASVLYRLSDESFFANQQVVSDLALRASYGRTGNQEGLGNFASLGLYGGGANYGDRPGIAPTQLANPDLSWEKTDQLNLGFDAGFLDDRVGLTFDWYRKNTSDLLLNRPIPLSTGFATITENIGEMVNQGYEVALRAQIVRPSRRNGFEWTSELNVSHNENEVTQLYRGEPINGSFVARVEEGQPLGFFRGWEMEGIFQSEAQICLDVTGLSCAPGTAYQSSGTVPGDVKFVDNNGRDANGELTYEPDGLITADDQTYIGSPWPDYQGGWTNSVSIAGFDASIFTQFSLGGDVYNGNREYTDGYGTFIDNNSGRARDRWTPENPSTTEARATWNDSNDNVRSSSRFVEDGSYVRIKNAVLGYNIPENFAGRMGLRTMRVYVQGQNLVTWTDYSGFDPEVNFNGAAAITRGIDFYTLPQARTLTVGLNVGF